MNDRVAISSPHLGGPRVEPPRSRLDAARHLLRPPRDTSRPDRESGRQHLAGRRQLHEAHSLGLNVGNGTRLLVARAQPSRSAALQREERTLENGEDLRQQSAVLQQGPPHPVRKGQRPLPGGHLRQSLLHQVRRGDARPLRVARGGRRPGPCTRRPPASPPCSPHSAPARSRAPILRTPGLL